MKRRDALRLLALLGGAAAAGSRLPEANAARARGADAALPPKPRGRGTVGVFYTPAYVGAAHAFETTRKARWVAESLLARPIVGLRLLANPSLGEAALLGAHDRAYVNAVRTGLPRELAQSQGFAWDPQLWTMVRASNGGVVSAALRAMKAGVAGSLSSGLHHARRDRGAGFCTFNGLAIAALQALAEGARRVLILDLDAHCGGGTHSILGEHAAIHQLDVAVDAFDRYQPRGGNTLDLVDAAADYLPTIARRLRALGGERFDLCLYNAGMDPHQGCPVGGLPGIDAGILARRETMVFDWCRARGLPIAFVLAGGYLGPGLSQSQLVDLHRLTLAAAAAA